MNFVIILYVFFAYPDLNLDTRQFYNRVLTNVFDQYAFVGIKFELTEDYNKASLFIDPCVQFDERRKWISGSELLGYAKSNIHINPFLYGIPKIEISSDLNDLYLEDVLKHEMYHILTPSPTHSDNPMSLMYFSYDVCNNKLDEQDSFYLQNIFKNVSHVLPKPELRIQH